jgi:type VI secretion system secreted protein VgrG
MAASSTAYTQENRFIAIDTPLGKDELLLASFSGTEAISRLFHLELSLLSANHNIKFEEIVGKSATLSIILADGSTRFLNGILSSFSQQRGGGENESNLHLSHYSAEMVPWLWLLTRTSDSRIFQNKSVPDIVEQIFSEKGFRDYKLSLHGSYNPREYCVQYRETDFNFIARLLEDEGIFYFFEHHEDKHLLVLADSAEDHKACPKQPAARYQTTTGGWLEQDVVTGIEKRQEITASKYTLTDYNFKTPGTDLKVEVTSQLALADQELEIYDHPGEYDKRAGGEHYSNLRMQEEEARITTITGTGNCRAFCCGYRFDLKNYFRSDLNNKSLVLTQVVHSASQEGTYLSGSREPDFAYTNHFTCIPFEVPFRPARITPKPVVQGSQTAIVTGPSGEEIYTDEHGRVKVQFHWDREGKKDDKTSCWMRVSQAWAGSSWGAMCIPRIGQEVIVDFLEGDPDQPIIIGRVYHGSNKPPYPLPAEKTKSTIKSDSSKGGGGSNELRFEDKKGAEEIYLHGQKDWTIAILNDKNQTVGHDESLTVANNRTKTVGVNQTESIGANLNETVGSSKTETIAAAKALTIGAGYQVSVGAAMNETVGGAKAEEIGAAKVVLVGANSTEQVGSNKSVAAGKDVDIQSGKKMRLDAGDDFSLDGKKKGLIQIADQLTIKVGSASITMKKSGEITISGKNINIKGSGNIVMKANKILEN